LRQLLFFFLAEVPHFYGGACCIGEMVRALDSAPENITAGLLTFPLGVVYAH